MTCKLCRETKKDWEGSDRRCAFQSGVFSHENWNCVTLNKLRAIEEEQMDSNVCYSEDQKAVLLEMDSELSGGKFIVLCWYKSRGRTDQAFILDGHGINPLTLEAAEETLAYHQDELTGAAFDHTIHDIETFKQQERAALTLMEPFKEKDEDT